MPQLLTTKREKWATQRQKNTKFKGSRLVYNASIQKKYVAKLRGLVRVMAAETKREIVKLFKSEAAQNYYAMDANIASQARILTNKLKAKFEALFGGVAKDLATDMVESTVKTSANNLGQSLKQLSGGLSLKTDFMHDDLKTVTKAAVTENMALIKSIPIDYLGRVQKKVMQSIGSGNGLDPLYSAIQKYDGITERRAKNIALDQTRKVYNTVNKSRMQKVGVKHFEWVHSGGGQHPRQEHIDMSGNIYSLVNPPIIDSKTGERGIPGQLPNCKCTMVPVYDFDTGEEDSE